MASSLTVAAFVDDTGAFAVKDPALFRREVKQFAGKDVLVTVQVMSSKRSLAQNRWLWGQALPAIAEHCGYDRHEHERLHYDLLAVRFGTVAVAPMITGAPPRIVPAKTSSDLSVEEFSDYMEWLVRYAADPDNFGVVIPLPSEMLGREPKAGA